MVSIHKSTVTSCCSIEVSCHSERIIVSFLDEGAVDEFIVTVVPTFIGKGIPLLAPRHREVALRLLGVQQFPDGVVQLHYEVQRSRV